ncbi:hypothetical protein V6N13_103205 [Hibiscus sabdariffa]
MTSRGSNVVSLFVGNISTKLHWSGLRQAFDRHSDIVDSYIAKKVDRNGKRFGFVRFSNRSDAGRAMERLNGFKLYGFRLSVCFAKFNARTTYWRKKRASQATQRSNGLNQERTGSGGVDRTGEDMVGRADKEDERKHSFDLRGKGKRN